MSIGDKLDKYIRILIGSTFLVAAILKMFSVDEFEIYIYSFDIFNFLITTVLSRLLLAGELLLGLFLIFNIRPRLTWFATMIVMLAFTVFLAYTAVFRADDNCHCFGEIIELTPLESIVKNLIIIVLLYIIRPLMLNDDRKEKSVFLPLIFVVASLSIPFIVTPPDSLYKMIYSSEKEINTIDFYESLDDLAKFDFSDENVLDSTAVIDVEEGKYLIGFVSAGCKYCKIGVKKLSLIMKNNDVDDDMVKFLIWGSPDGVREFMRETDTEDFSYWHIMPNKAIDITYGMFPLFVWLEDKKIVNIGDFRDIDDDIFGY